MFEEDAKRVYNNISLRFVQQNNSIGFPHAYDLSSFRFLVRYISSVRMSDGRPQIQSKDILYSSNICGMIAPEILADT